MSCSDLAWWGPACCPWHRVSGPWKHLCLFPCCSGVGDSGRGGVGAPGELALGLGVEEGVEGLAPGPLACLAVVEQCTGLLPRWTLGRMALGISVLPSSSWYCCLVMPRGAISLPPSSGSSGHVSQGPRLFGKRGRALGSVVTLCQGVGISGLVKSRSPGRNKENYFHLISL